MRFSEAYWRIDAFRWRRYLPAIAEYYSHFSLPSPSLVCRQTISLARFPSSHISTPRADCLFFSASAAPPSIAASSVAHLPPILMGAARARRLMRGFSPLFEAGRLLSPQAAAPGGADLFDTRRLRYAALHSARFCR